ncbi:Hypothetical protein CAP_0799 [Chondromyces apiculatus DSM 436]|uniref:Uncharacterized protein n=1 Tax=Chondromyces apiculatus DSM 436 TaxID=1192034 RepID=A0A017TER2_9BACT|nr:Hypothetical protein CAP_0799 [Chondromyces apiculatus DSM 436]
MRTMDRHLDSGKRHPGGHLASHDTCAPPAHTCTRRAAHPNP